jgi:hypothetical protein
MKFFKSLKDIEERYLCLYTLNERITSLLPSFGVNLNDKRRRIAHEIDNCFEYIAEHYRHRRWVNKNKHDFGNVLCWCSLNLEGSYIWYDETIWFKNHKDLMFFLLRWA